MEEKKSKGFLGKLFLPKSNKSCCNIQFEEITDEKNTTETEKEETSEDKKLDSKEHPENNKQMLSGGCC